MRIRAKKISRKMKVTRIFAISLFAIIVSMAALVPHIFKGHTIGQFVISEHYEQSIVILLGSLLSYAFYRIYRKKMFSLKTEYEEIERYLRSSYEHIGRVNNELELLKNFISTYPPGSVSKMEEKKLYSKLLSYMLVSVANTNEGFVRFVDIQSGKTLKEFFYARGKNHASTIKLSNSSVAVGDLQDASEKNVEVVESYYQQSPIKCVLCFPKKQNNFDRSLLQLLLTHIHLMFLASHSSYTVAN